MQLNIKKVEDFKITGDGSNSTWDKAQWQDLTPVGDGPLRYKTRAKALWSDLGLYFLFDCEDKVLNCTMTGKNNEIYMEDVAELFLWPDENEKLYFEYEISPLNNQLALLVPNDKGDFHGWAPFIDEDERESYHKATVTGGPQVPGADIEGWRAECFIPFKLLLGMKNCPPTPGMSWRGNLCRIDNDAHPRTFWSWSPKTGEDFHDYNNYGTLTFIE